MKKNYPLPALLFCVALIPGSVVAADVESQAHTREYNRQYFELRADIDVAKSRASRQNDRELAFKNLADLLTAGPDAHWLTVKDGYLEILVADTDFFLAQAVKNPDAHSVWIAKVGFNWLYSGESRYPEIKSLAVKALKESIADQEKKLRVAKETLKAIQAAKPTVVH